PAGVQQGLSPAVQRHVAGVTARVPRYAGFGGTATAPPPAPQPSQAAPVPVGAEGMIETAQQWSAILRAWYDMGGELFGGTLTVRGHPAWNIGHRLFSWDQRGDWEAYIEGVGHRFDMRTGQYETMMRYSRGWYLAATVAAQIWEEGRTQIAATSGGPPERDPATGQPIKEVLVTIPAQEGVLEP